MRKPTIVLAILFLFGCSAFAQSVYTPEKGTPERKEILDALRLPVERELKQKIVFTADWNIEMGEELPFGLAILLGPERP